MIKTTVDQIHIFLAADNNFALPLSVAISSVLRNSAADDHHFFYILNKDITLANQKKIHKLKEIKNFDIEFIDINDELFKDCPKTCEHIPIQTYYRYLIPQLKPQLQKALYLDCDILVVKSLKELWNVDLANTYVAAVEEMDKETSHEAARLGINAYFNAGVLLINCQKWRQEHLCEKLIATTQDLYERGLLKFMDQDVLNYTFKDNVRWLSPKFNYQQGSYPNFTYTQYTEDTVSKAEVETVINHYNTYFKPWNNQGHKCTFRKEEYLVELRNDKFYWPLFKITLLPYAKRFVEFCFSMKTERRSDGKYKKFTLFGLHWSIKKNH